ncbi:MAG TPA: LCP family protein [Thermomicrobiales bacterium]|nr:LCP family protein [Thermomicrobiales bacterium]
MPEPRRLSVSSPPPRKRGTPAYQVRRGHRSAAAGQNGATQATEPTSNDASDDLESADDYAPQPETQSSTGTEAMPAVTTEPDDDARNTSVDEPGPPSDEADQNAEAIVEDEGPSAPEDEEPVAEVPSDDPDYADYARSVEEAAARSRLEMAPQAAATAAYPAVPSRVAQQPVVQRPTVRQTRGRPVVGSRVRSDNGGRGRGGGKGRTGAGDRERDPRPMLKRPKTWLVIFGIIVAIVAIAAVLWAANIARITYNAYNDAHVDPPARVVYTVNEQGTPVAVPTEQVQASLPNWDNQDPFNVLLMGIDDREGDAEPPRSDTMIVMRINPATNHVVMMSIPRDLMVFIPIADRWDKINAAYPIGEEQDTNGGPPAVMETIEANFDVRVHYFVTVDFEGFRTIVDTVGGVIIDVDAPIKDDQYPTETLGLTREYFPTGLQKMDGETALRFSRTRHGDNDIARGERQQQMLVALREQAVGLGLITKAEELIRQMGSMVKTDFNFNQLLALANLGRSVDPNGISKVNLWDAGVLTEHFPEDEFDAFYFEADWPAVHELMDVYFTTTSSDPPPPTPTISVPETTSSSPVTGDTAVDLDIPIIIQNDAGISGLATAVSQTMADAGFTIVSPEAGSGSETETIIYDYAESPDTALYIASQLGLDESSIVYGNGGNGIVVALGSDVAWVLDQ